MKYLLDTNAIIAILKKNKGFSAKLKEHQPSDFGIPSIVYHELLFGAYNSKKVEQNLQILDSLQFMVLEFSQSDARVAGQIRANLRRLGTPIGPYDVLIAGQAVERSMVLITNNMKEFCRVSDLAVEDWLS